MGKFGKIWEKHREKHGNTGSLLGRRCRVNKSVHRFAAPYPVSTELGVLLRAQLLLLLLLLACQPVW